MALPTVGTVTVFLVFFAILSKVWHFILLSQKNEPECMSKSSQTYLFNSSYNVYPSAKVTMNLKYAFRLKTGIYCFIVGSFFPVDEVIRT